MLNLKTNKMKNQDFELGQEISVGNFIVSIGAFNKRDVAIFSKSTGKFCEFKHAGNKLKKVKRVFKTWLNSNETFTFSFMTKNITEELIKNLK
tara:strand:- start:31 stop:309 length:279 start_codon:yes stop_codon:yes gene_type:complete